MRDKFCAKCGTPLTTKFEGGRERPACPACGYVVFNTLGQIGTISRWIIERYRPADAVLFRLPDDEQPYFRQGSQSGIVFAPAS